ncbi:TPA: DUF1642 domain-containing protein [Streptococcus suis]|nr:DUF1642 domain-containing protein [Streptococcus suis]
MNKQEAIKRVEELYGYGSIAKTVTDIISQIDEPQTVVVPKFVAEWIKSHKESFSDASAIDMYDNLTSDNRSGYYHEVWLWVIAHHHDFIKAWHDGYEIEQEKLYTVEVVGTGQYLVERYKKQGYVFIDTEDPLLFTKSELEAAGFGWVFDCDGVKVEEVEEN